MIMRRNCSSFSLVKKIIFTSLILTLITRLPLLHSMESQTTDALILPSMASDFQIYQLISTINSDSPSYLPNELVQTITLKAHTITTLHCYNKHKTCLDSIVSLLDFIKKQEKDNVDSAATADILKLCFAYSGKSLYTLKDKLNQTVFHAVITRFVCLKKITLLNYSIDVLCQTAGKDIIDVLRLQDCNDVTALQNAVYFALSDVVKKLITSVGDKKLELISINNNGTALDLAKIKRKDLLTWISRPEFASINYWSQINEMNIIIDLLEHYSLS